MQLDQRYDYLTWDNVSQALYESARAVPSIADLPARYDGQTPAPPTPASRNRPLFLEVAKRRNMTQRELSASGGVYTSLDQIWIAPDVLFPVNVISKPGDVVVELPDGTPESQPGTRWTVLDWAWGKNRQTRRLTCRDLVLAYDLRDSITIERCTLSYDAAGVPVKRFPSDATPGGIVLYAGLPARVQLIGKPTEEERGVRGSAGKYEIFVGREIDVTDQDRVLLSNGMYLDVLDYLHAQEIAELPRIVATRKI